LVTEKSAAVLDMRGVSKSFGQVVALRSGSLKVDAGSIHALVGENGAGKSTLIKIVAGVHRRGSRELLLDGESVDFSSTAESKAAGVAVIYQERAGGSRWQQVCEPLSQPPPTTPAVMREGRCTGSVSSSRFDLSGSRSTRPGTKACGPTCSWL